MKIIYLNALHPSMLCGGGRVFCTSLIVSSSSTLMSESAMSSSTDELDELDEKGISIAIGSKPQFSGIDCTSPSQNDITCPSSSSSSSSSGDSKRLRLSSGDDKLSSLLSSLLSLCLFISIYLIYVVFKSRNQTVKSGGTNGRGQEGKKIREEGLGADLGERGSKKASYYKFPVYSVYRVYRVYPIPPIPPITAIPPIPPSV